MKIHSLMSREFPDTGDICCMGCAAMGPGHCTCWEPVYDSDTNEPWNGCAPQPAKSMCHDCAYRKDSPERSCKPGYSGDQETLDDIVLTGQKFFCHQGVRRVLYYKHPSGMTHPGHPADFDWRFAEKDGEKFPIKADGSPVEICGGWFKRRSKHTEGNLDVVVHSLDHLPEENYA